MPPRKKAVRPAQPKPPKVPGCHPLKLQTELNGKYVAVLDELQKLEREYPMVIRNQDALVTDNVRVLLNSYASLLYGVQESDEPVSPKQLRDALYAFEHVPGLRPTIIEHICELFPATVLLIEHLYFQNRAARRRFNETAGDFVDEDLYLYPDRRVERIRNLTRAIWRTDVLQATAE